MVAGMRPTTTQHVTQKVLFKLLVAGSTCALDASKAKSSLTHKHAHMTEPTKLESVSGMDISRH